MTYIKEALRGVGFFSIQFDRPGSIQIAANHNSGIAVWFYCKHNLAQLCLFDRWFTWGDRDEEINICHIWEYMEGREIDTKEVQVSTEDMGGLLSDEEVLGHFLTMWMETSHASYP